MFRRLRDWKTTFVVFQIKLWLCIKIVPVFLHCELSLGECRGHCAEVAGGSLDAQELHTRLAQSSWPDWLHSWHSIQESRRDRKWMGHWIGKKWP